MMQGQQRTAAETETAIVLARAARAAAREALWLTVCRALAAGATVAEPWGDGRIEWRVRSLAGGVSRREARTIWPGGVAGDWHDATSYTDRTIASGAAGLADHLLARQWFGPPFAVCSTCGGAWGADGCVDGCGRR